MANTTTRGRGAGSPGRRSVTAAARAAARRTERAGLAAAEGREDDADDESGQRPPEQHAGPVLRVEDPSPAPEAPEPSEAPEEAGHASSGEARSGPSRGRRRGLVSAVLAVVVVAGLVAAAVLGWTYWDGRRTDAARVQALAAARKAAPVVLSYDHRRLDQNFAAALGHLTGSFRDEYRRTTKAVVAPTAKKYQGVVKATVVKPPGGGAPAASVVSASPDRAVVLLFVNQVTRSTQVTGDRVDLNRVRMTLTLTSGGWKVSAVDAL
ncbi:hypothetical protein NLX86_14420 [Streptomyces sp. A3M-1-3]|uniref:hypothetical protein n=1 Tax=Streptomyces sp. A3M-1-3 TaxID=2962044 RepID=UPI0020B6B4CB|nr:hypothetical protein [Streptomyces sp. A3M-1-3]MCP3819254.1 hypothetical protein [Streptomyces sp. A3M-1-3]